jgi:hypothetical protein
MERGTHGLKLDCTKVVDIFLDPDFLQQKLFSEETITKNGNICSYLSTIVSKIPLNPTGGYQASCPREMRLFI